MEINNNVSLVPVELSDNIKDNALQTVKSLYKSKYYKDWEGGADSLSWIENGFSIKDFTYWDSQKELIFRSELPHENRINFIVLNCIDDEFSTVLELSNVVEYSITSDNKFLIIDKGGSPGPGLWDEKYQVYSYQKNKYVLVWEDYKKQVNSPFEKPSSHLEGTIKINGDCLTYEYKSFSIENTTGKIGNTTEGKKTFRYKDGTFTPI